MSRLLFSLFLISLFACRKTTPVIKPPAPEPPPVFTLCNLVQMVTNPAAVRAAERDTVFFDNSYIKQATAPGGTIKYTYQVDKLSKKEQFDAEGRLTKLSTYDHNSGAGQLLYEYKRNPANPSVVDSSTEFTYKTGGSYIDRMAEVTYYSNNLTSHRRYVITWDGGLENIENISVCDEANYPIATYTFTTKESATNPLLSAFPSTVYLFSVDPSGYDDAVRMGLFFSRREVTKVTATVPGFVPLNISYAFNDRNMIKEVMVNGTPAWRFRYACE
jgi:hypothetical protein